MKGRVQILLSQHWCYRTLCIPPWSTASAPCKRWKRPSPTAGLLWALLCPRYSQMRLTMSSSWRRFWTSWKAKRSQIPVYDFVTHSRSVSHFKETKKVVFFYRALYIQKGQQNRGGGGSSTKNYMQKKWNESYETEGFHKMVVPGEYCNMSISLGTWGVLGEFRKSSTSFAMKWHFMFPAASCYNHLSLMGLARGSVARGLSGKGLSGKGLSGKGLSGKGLSGQCKKNRGGV